MLNVPICKGYLRHSTKDRTIVLIILNIPIAKKIPPNACLFVLVTRQDSREEVHSEL